MTFEDWKKTWPVEPGIEYTVYLAAENAYKAGYSAATSEANTKLGDSANEAEKDARRKVAMDALSDRDFTDAELDTIIKVAQG